LYLIVTGSFALFCFLFTLFITKKIYRWQRYDKTTTQQKKITTFLTFILCVYNTLYYNIIKTARNTIFAANESEQQYFLLPSNRIVTKKAIKTAIIGKVNTRFLIFAGIIISCFMGIYFHLFGLFFHLFFMLFLLWAL
jgi:hypothetical protein